MFIDGVLSFVVTAVFVLMIILERGGGIEPASAKPAAKGLLHSAELLLVACIVLCNAIIWIPALLR
jgi:hypothetical protein